MTAQTLLAKVVDYPEKPQFYRQPLKEYLASHCFHPQKIWVYDSHLGRKKLMRVPCGVCFHCKETRKNEWVARCYAHAKDFKNVYFVTLTYRSLEPDIQEGTPAWFLRDYLKEALWHLDDFNFTGRKSWSPCVIWQPHFQKFIMRLRKNTGFTDITYICSYEYGKRFGRPHAHFIFFTNNDLTKSDIEKAWSLSLTQHAGKVLIKTKHKHGHRILFGNVDFHNLTTNGTFNEAQKVKVDSNYMSAAQCFKYVCKYMFKENYQTSRVRLAYEALYYNGHNSQENWKYRCKLFRKDTFEPALYDRSFVDFERTFKRQREIDHDIPELQQSSKTLYTINLKLYERNYQGDLPEVNYAGAIIPAGEVSNGQYEFVYSATFRAFEEQFRPLYRMSRGTPIGSLYAQTHIEQLSQGVFVCPTPEGVSCVVPSYFRRKASEFIYGLRVTSKTSSSLSYNKSCLPLIREDLSSACSGGSINFLPVYSGKIPYGDNKLFNSLCRSHYILKEGLIRFLILRSDAGYTVESFKYSRRDHSYKHYCRYDFLPWCNLYLSKLIHSFDVHSQLQTLFNQNEECYYKVVNLIDEMSPISFVELRDSIEADFMHDIQQQQERYDFTHSDPLDS